MPNIAIKDMLKWIDAQRDVVNTLINVAPPDRKDQYMPELYVINAIAERLQEMTAVEFFGAVNELRSMYCADGDCSDCPLEREKVRCGHNLCGYLLEYPVRYITIVKRWKEERDEN